METGEKAPSEAEQQRLYKLEQAFAVLLEATEKRPPVVVHDGLRLYEALTAHDAAVSGGAHIAGSIADHFGGWSEALVSRHYDHHPYQGDDADLRASHTLMRARIARLQVPDRPVSYVPAAYDVLTFITSHGDDIAWDDARGIYVARRRHDTALEFFAVVDAETPVADESKAIGRVAMRLVSLHAAPRYKIVVLTQSQQEQADKELFRAAKALSR